MFKIKPLEKADISLVYNLMSEPNNISALHTDIISLTEWQKSFAEAENDADEENFIVYQNDTPCCWLKLNGLKNNETAWISMLVVADSFKHQGIGQYAVKVTVEYLAKKGYSQVKLQTTKDNLPAINLYTKLGFEQLENKESKIIFSKPIRQKLIYK